MKISNKLFLVTFLTITNLTMNCSENLSSQNLPFLATIIDGKSNTERYAMEIQLIQDELIAICENNGCMKIEFYYKDSPQKDLYNLVKTLTYDDIYTFFEKVEILKKLKGSNKKNLIRLLEVIGKL